MISNEGETEMKNHKGQTLTEILVIIAIGICIAAFPVGYYMKHVAGNKQIFDLRQNFKYAYVTEGTNVVRYGVKAWKDWENSDAIQVITTDDRCIYTHLNRVILSDR